MLHGLYGLTCEPIEGSACGECAELCRSEIRIRKNEKPTA
jgi:hypothetical protein